MNNSIMDMTYTYDLRLAALVMVGVVSGMWSFTPGGAIPGSTSDRRREKTR